MRLATRVRTRAIKSLASGARMLARVQKSLLALPLLLRDEETEAELCKSYYAQAEMYREESYLASGLFPFESRMLKQFFPPPPARLLLPGAGGGRELRALREAGYCVEAFDANPVLVGKSGANIRLATVGEWAPTGATYDGVFTGWALWTHLLRQRDRLTALRGFRQSCPSGPVLLSFWRMEKVLDHLEQQCRPEILRATQHDGLLRALANALGREPTERGTVFSTSGFFAHLVSEAELVEECERTGYRLAYYERNGSRYPHAIVVPEDSRGQPKTRI